jgi:hypothetical protein
VQQGKCRKREVDEVVLPKKRYFFLRKSRKKLKCYTTKKAENRNPKAHRNGVMKK